MRGAAVAALVSLGIPAAASSAAPTFAKDVAPIIFKSCVRCHRPGDIASTAPFLSYETVRPWAKAIKEKVVTREMPPWSADPLKSAKFRNDPRLSPQEIDTLVKWVDSGAPKGNAADLPPPPKFENRWLHPEGRPPDLVISLPGDFKVPAKGEIPYVRFFAKVPSAEDQWISASQARPGNPALVHHMAITEVEFPEGMTPDDLGPAAEIARQLGLPGARMGTRPAVTIPGNPAVFDMLGVYTPGTTLETYENGSGKLLKGGTNMYLNFNIHYTTTGKPETDRSAIAFWFLPAPPKHPIFRVPVSGETIIAAGKELLTDSPGEKAEGTRVAIPPIPPNARNYEVIGITAFTEPITIFQLQPHAHLRAKDFEYSVVYPDGREQIVLSVPKYNFNWQLAYELDTPLQLPAGSKLVITAHYDNSRNNQYNPAPDKEVYFRAENQSWDEMFTPFVQYAADRTGSPLNVVEIGGCIEPGFLGKWTLVKANDPVFSKVQASSSAELRAAAGRPLGQATVQLLGADAFKPAVYQGERVTVKGLLLNGRLNVTSLEKLAAPCF